MDRKKIKELAWKNCLIEDDKEVTQDVLAFVRAIEREILDRSHFVRLPSGEYIRGDEVTSVRKLDGEKFGQNEYLPRVAVDFGNNCIVINCVGDGILNDMADAIMRDVDSAVAAIKGRWQDLVDAAITDARHFEAQRDMLLAALENACRCIGFGGFSDEKLAEMSNNNGSVRSLLEFRQLIARVKGGA